MKAFINRNPSARALIASAGFTLPELLVGVVLGAVVLAALGGSVLVSQMRISTKVRADIERRDALNRAVALIRSEISAADRVFMDSTGLCPFSTQPSLVLEFLQDAGFKICYSIQSVSNVKRDFRSDFPWSGSCLLTRRGTTYDPVTGLIDTTVKQVSQVILDNLDGCAAFVVTTVGGQQGAAGGSILRDVDIEIRQLSGVTTNFSARVASNPLYTYPAASDSVGPVCSWRSLPTSTPENCATNIYYFPKNLERYEITDCSHSSCTVKEKSTSVTSTLNKVNVLVFPDREIRP